MAYSSIIDPTAYFQTVIYTGNATARSITFDGNSDMQPDWIWGKQRSGTDSHQLTDVVRGVTKILNSDTTAAENTTSAAITAFNSDGFSLGTGGGYNGNNVTQVAWNWKAGTSFTNDASGTGIGSVDSTGSVNQTSGFSIMSWTGTGANATVAHGLGATPKMMIFKVRDGATAWVVYHKNVGPTKGLFLNTTGTGSTVSAYFQDTNPTSSVFSVGSDADTNGSSKSMITYCFAEKQGYSKFGSYEGNSNTNGTFVYLGFKPAWLMVKPIDAVDNWVMFDNKRLGFNSSTSPFNFAGANNANAETSDTGQLDLLSNGFKIRNSGGTVNKSSTYIYMAFAENPFVASNYNVATAR